MEPVSEEAPEGIMPKEAFKSAVIDFHLLEAYVEEEYGNSDSSLFIFKKLEEEVYKKHNTTKSIYLKSYNYYLKNTERDMDPMYESIVDELSKIEIRTRAEENKTKKVDEK